MRKGLNKVKASTFRCYNVICPYRASENHPFYGWLLLEDRKNILDNEGNLDVTNELYEIVANHRNVTMNGLKGTKDELSKLDKYIQQNGIEDGFAYDLAQYRLGRISQQIESKTSLTPEQIDNFLKQEYPAISNACLEIEEQEIKHEKSESIKDEIGDEFQPKTEAQEQEEQQVEAMWQNRFQSWDRNTINLPNEAKRKEEAVKVIQDIERDKQVQAEKKEQQTENEQR